MKGKPQEKQVVIYQAKNGAIELRGDFTHENIWATQAQIADIFGSDRSVITKHIRNIFKDRELDRKSVCAKFAHTGDDGKTYNVQFYNLDIILSVGYRTNSKLAIGFRKWATKTLRSHIVDGFTVNKERIAKNYTQFLSVVEDVKKLLPLGTAVDPKDAVELITLFADTWLSLDAYDKGILPKGKFTKKKVSLSAEHLSGGLAELRAQLLNKSEATDIFWCGKKQRGRGRNCGDRIAIFWR